MAALDSPQNWYGEPQHDAGTRRSRSFGGCGTCRARRMKCDEKRPICAMCKASQLVCAGYEKSIFFGSADAAKSGGQARFRRHILTETERRSMSETIRSGVPPSQALGNIAEIDDRCEAASASCENFQITRGPFGAFRFAGTLPKKSIFGNENLETLDPALTWDRTVESTEETPPSPHQHLHGVTDDVEEADDALPPTSDATNSGALSPLSIGAILNDLDVPLVNCSSLPWLSLNEDCRIQDVSDEMPWTDMSSPLVLPPALSQEAGEIPPLCDLPTPQTCSDSLTIPQSVHQHVPRDAVVLLKHYSTTVLTSLTPFQHSKTPWHILFIPHVKSCLAALTLGEKLDHATLCTFYATLAMSASSLAGISALDKWHEQSRVYKQHAHWHALHLLQTAYIVPKVAKYKSILMALLTMVQVSTMIGDLDQAECYLLETEKLIRIKGLNRRKSRKVRLLHHCYAFERLIHESSWPSRSTSAYQKRIHSEIESSGAGAFSQDSLEFELSRWSDLDKEMPRLKGQDEGENDLHLQIPGSWPATLYPEIFGVPEIHIFLLSMILRLTNAKHDLSSAKGNISVGEFMMRAKSIERMIYRRHPYRVGVADSESTQSQRLLDALVQAMQEALAIFFYRSVYDVDSRLLQGNVASVCDCLRQINATDPGFGAIAITGAASGMGLATAQALAARGALLSLADISETALSASKTTLHQPDAHLYITVDVSQSSSVDEWIKQTVEHFGKLDGAVNMAGVIAPATPVTEVADDDWDRTFSVNTRGIFNCLRAQLRNMSTGGSIVSAASVFGQFGAPGNAAYCASKAAVIGLTRTAAKENQHIRVNCVSPGSTNTPMSRGEDPEHVRRGLQVTAQKRRAEPVEIANVIVFLLSKEASFVTGAVWNVDGGWVC